MKLSQAKAKIFIPDNTDVKKALARTTHLAVGAHPDDLEIMAYHGVLQGYLNSEKHFTGVVVCDGANSPRSGKYEKTTDEEMIELRQQEQMSAAREGKYNAVVLLAHESQKAKESRESEIVDELTKIFEITKPHTVYLHNLADKHDTHVAIALKSILALRKLSAKDRPTQVLGCEVWRDLDWLPDRKKKVLPVSEHMELAKKIIAAHDSQVSGGKRYDNGAIGRRKANATFFESNETDKENMLSFAMDLLPLVEAKDFDPRDYAEEIIDSFKAEVLAKINKYWAK